MDWNSFLTKFIKDFEFSEKSGETIKEFFPFRDKRHRSYKEVCAALDIKKSTLSDRVNTICSNIKLDLDLSEDGFKLDCLQFRIVEEYNRYCQSLSTLQSVVNVDDLSIETEELSKEFAGELKDRGISYVPKQVKAMVQQCHDFNIPSREVLRKVLSIVCPDLEDLSFKSPDDLKAQVEHNNSVISPSDDDLELAHQITVKILDLKFKYKLNHE
jgi:hypothetical protein